MDELDTWLERVYAADGDRDTLDRLYDEWAEQYDGHIWASGNPYIAIAAGMVGRHVPDWSAPILDAGCGTGNMGQVLHQMGYNNLTGLDASEGMLQLANRKASHTPVEEPTGKQFVRKPTPTGRQAHIEPTGRNPKRYGTTATPTRIIQSGIPEELSGVKAVLVKCRCCGLDAAMPGWRTGPGRARGRFH